MAKALLFGSVFVLGEYMGEEKAQGAKPPMSRRARTGAILAGIREADLWTGKKVKWGYRSEIGFGNFERGFKAGN